MPMHHAPAAALVNGVNAHAHCGIMNAGTAYKARLRQIN